MLFYIYFHRKDWIKETMPVDEVKVITQMIRNVCDNVDSITDGLGSLGDADARTTLEDIRVGELEHIQMLTLELTRMIMNNDSSPEIMETDSADASAFAMGELNYNKGEYKHEDVPKTCS